VFVDHFDRSSCADVGSAPTAAFAEGYDCSVLRGRWL